MDSRKANNKLIMWTYVMLYPGLIYINVHHYTSKMIYGWLNTRIFSTSILGIAWYLIMMGLFIFPYVLPIIIQAHLSYHEKKAEVKELLIYHGLIVVIAITQIHANMMSTEMHTVSSQRLLFIVDALLISNVLFSLKTE